MTIDKAKLVELLVDKTGLEKEKVEEQLSQLVGRIHQAAQQGKTFEVEGLGTFSVKEDTLHFDPADTLETEINHKYAGMKPIELIGAFKEAQSREEYEPEEGAAAEHTIQEKTEPPADEVLGVENDYNNFVPLEEFELKASGDQETGASFVFDEERADEEEIVVEAERQETETAVVSVEKDDKDSKSKDPIGSVIVVCVIVLAVGVAGWAVYDFGLLNALESNTSTASTVAQREQNVQSTPDTPDSDLTEEVSGNSSSDPIVSSERSEDSGDEEQPAENSVSSRENDNNTMTGSTVYGLTGTVSSGGNTGYTIVVYSLSSRSKAQARQNDLSSEGYRAVLMNAQVNGQTYWRVGLGQFETVADAQNVANSLPEPYSKDHFIKRIQ